MENNTAPNIQVYITPTPWYKRKIMWIYLLVLLLIPLSFYIFKTYFLKAPATPVKTSSQFQPDSFPAQKAQDDLLKFAKTALQSQLIPSSFNIQPTLDAKGKVLDPNRFNSFWNMGKILANTSIRYSVEGQIEDKNILLTLPNTIESLTATSAATVANQYFSTKLAGSFKCDKVDLKDKTGSKATLCEDFEVDGQGVKTGLGIISPLPNDQKSSIFYCELYPQSPIYRWKSCSIYKAQTGWQ